MKLLDLFCGAGGCSVGYSRAGFDVVGVDINPQPNYPFEFHQADALHYDLKNFDVIHASPPCQAYSEATPLTTKSKHPKLIHIIRERLIATGKPYIIENVEGARKDLLSPIKLCGTMFELGVWRHRYFEINIPIVVNLKCNHIGHPVTVNPPANARKNQGPRNFAKEIIAMGIDWMNKKEISQAIPPEYTQFIGKKIMESLRM